MMNGSGSQKLVTAELCTKARQLGLLGEAVAAEQSLAERKGQASHALAASAAAGSAASYEATVTTAQTAAVDASTLTAAAATFAMRCSEAAGVLSIAAEKSSWSDFASARKLALFLGLHFQKDEVVIQQRRDAAAKAVSETVGFCLESWTVQSAQPQSQLSITESGHRAKHDSSLDLLCAVCTQSSQQQQQSADKAATAWSAEHASCNSDTMFHSAVSLQDDTALPHCQPVVALIAQALQAVDPYPSTKDLSFCTHKGIDQSPWDQPQPQSKSQSQSQSSQCSWEDCMSALSKLLSKQQVSRSPSRYRQHPQGASQSPAGDASGSMTASSGHWFSDLAAALTAARCLGLTNTVKLALHIVQTHIQLQQQEQQSVVAEYDLPTDEHAEDCTSAWQSTPEAWQNSPGVWQEAPSVQQDPQQVTGENATHVTELTAVPGASNSQMLEQAFHKSSTPLPKPGGSQGHPESASPLQVTQGVAAQRQEEDLAQQLVAKLQRGECPCTYIVADLMLLHDSVSRIKFFGSLQTAGKF